MPTMLERASRAFCRAMGQDPDELVPMVASPPLPAWQAYLPAIRAAFVEGREPSEGMKDAGLRGIPWSEPVQHDDMGAIWQAMLDAGLAETDAN